MAKEVILDAKTVLLRLTDENGNQGWGEASIAPLMTGETLDSLLASLKYLTDKALELEWEDPRLFAKSFDSILYGNASAKSCLEMALLDLYTQKNSLSFWQYLRSIHGDVDGKSPAPIPLLRMLGGTLDRELADAISLRKVGYSHWKIKVGALSLEEDLHRVQMISNLLEGDTISVDANGAMDLDDAIRFCESPLTSKLAFAEQLIHADSDLEDFIKLKRCSPIPIGLDESFHGPAEIEVLIKAGVFDGASLKLIKTGGVLPAWKCANILRANKLRLNLACKVAETSLSGAATASIGFAMGGVIWGFSMSNQYLRFDICDHPLVANHGCLDVMQLNKTGVGVTPNLNRVKDALAQGYAIIQC